MNPSLLSRVIRLIVIAFAAQMLSVNALAEWKEKVLYSFQGGSDGYQPAGGVVLDKSGHLYGATSYNNSCASLLDCGTVFELSLQNGAWVETTLHQFRGHAHNDGGAPVGGVILDAMGNVYGTTAYGGNGGCVLLGSKVGCGTVYELSPPTQKGGHWVYAVLYNFQGGKDGLFPWGDLTLDKAGNLYGATQFGGGKGTSCNQYFDGNCGTVFQLSPPKVKGGKWTETILHRFAGIASGGQQGDGANPNGGLIFDSKGAIYGTTYFGGNQKCKASAGVGCGVVFELRAPSETGKSWTERILYYFQGNPDGSSPAAGVIFGVNGQLYGTTIFGGIEGAGGTVFELKQLSRSFQAWTENVIYRFTDKADGAQPSDALVIGAKGSLYGTTTIGGEGSSAGGDVFELKPPSVNGRAWTLSVLHGFGGRPDGLFSAAGLVFDKNGSLYSTTQQGGKSTACLGGCGTVFRVSP